MSIWLVLSVLFLHWVADFVLQTHKWSVGKSKNWEDLLSHTFTYTLMWLIPVAVYGVYTDSPGTIMWFLPITFATHTAIDFYTSRVNAQLYKDDKHHDFFVSIGFDQFLHYAQLFLTIKLLL